MKEESNYNIQKGIFYMQNEEYSKASIEFSKAIDKNPTSLAYTLLGASLYWMGDVKGSIEEYKKAIEMDENNAIAWQLKGISMAKLQYIDEALNDFEKALSIDPKRADVHMNIGSIYFSKGYISSAIDYIKKAIKLDSSNPLFYYQLGLIYFYLERYQEADSNFEKAILLYRDYEEAILWLGISKERQGDIKKALEQYKKAVSIKPYDFFARYKIALNLIRLNQTKDIEKYISQCFLLTPQNEKGGISLSLSYSFPDKKNQENDSINPKKDETIPQTTPLDEIYKNLMRVSNDEEIKFSVDIMQIEKPEIEKINEKNLSKALSENFKPLIKKYISKSYTIPPGNSESRKKLIENVLKDIEAQIQNEKYQNYRINFTMNTKKTKNEDIDKNEKTPSVTYYPRNVGNDMGLWIIGNNWISVLEDDIQELNDLKESPEKNLISGLANMLLGEGLTAEKYFQASEKTYPVLSKSGIAISNIFLGNEEKAIILFEEILKIDRKNKIATENLKWLKQKK